MPAHWHGRACSSLTQHGRAKCGHGRAALQNTFLQLLPIFQENGTPMSFLAWACHSDELSLEGLLDLSLLPVTFTSHLRPRQTSGKPPATIRQPKTQHKAPKATEKA